MWRRRIAIAVGAALVVGLVAVAGTVVVVHLKHPRDEAAYLEYLRLYGRGVQTSATGDDFTDAPIALPSIPALLTEGDRACHWLGQQGYALWRTDLAHRVDALYRRYDAANQGRQLPLDWDPDLDSVTAGAWAHLCPATLDLHKPHFVFSSAAARLSRRVPPPGVLLGADWVLTAARSMQSVTDGGWRPR